MVRSEGLLQLTYMDAERYGCDFDWEADKALPEKDPARTILQPRNNLTCGVKILENQLITLKRPLLTRSSYWSTLQPGTSQLSRVCQTDDERSCGLPAECSDRVLRDKLSLKSVERILKIGAQGDILVSAAANAHFVGVARHWAKYYLQMPGYIELFLKERGV